MLGPPRSGFQQWTCETPGSAPPGASAGYRKAGSVGPRPALRRPYPWMRAARRRALTWGGALHAGDAGGDHTGAPQLPGSCLTRTMWRRSCAGVWRWRGGTTGRGGAVWPDILGISQTILVPVRSMHPACCPRHPAPACQTHHRPEPGSRASRHPVVSAVPQGRRAQPAAVRRTPPAGRPGRRTRPLHAARQAVQNGGATCGAMRPPHAGHVFASGGPRRRVCHGVGGGAIGALKPCSAPRRPCFNRDNVFHTS